MRTVKTRRNHQKETAGKTVSVDKARLLPARSAAESHASPGWALALGVAGLVAVGLLVGLPSIDRAEVNLQPASDSDEPHSVVVPVPPAAVEESTRASREPVVQPAPRAAKLPTAASASATTSPVVPTSAPVAVPGVETSEKPRAEAVVPPAPPAAEPPPARAGLVTLTGCLETDDERFRLNDTTGSNAPKSRSWKTGFLTKRPATIAIVDASGVGLPAHVGQRVSLTGTLVDRNMHVHSLQRVAASCE